jgi:hypothetical protein
MSCLPYRTFRVISPLTPDEVRQRMALALESRKRSAGGSALFKGKLSGDRFRFMPVVSGRNSFVPLIRGLIVQNNDGTNIEGTMSLPPLILAFMALFSGFLLFVAIKRWNAVTGRTGWLETLWVIGLWVFALFEFAVQARKAQCRLEEILEAPIP